MPISDQEQEYLNSTRLCDFGDPKVRDKATEIIKAAETPEEKALQVFYFVRDRILFGLDYFDAKASQTLKKQIGFCFTKANLQVALLRAAGIPARYHLVHLDSAIAKKTSPKLMTHNLKAFMTHPWAECYLSGNWVACDSTFDKLLLKGLVRKGFKEFSREQIPAIDWNGQHDLIPFKPWIEQDVGIFSSLDNAILELTKSQDEGLPKKPPKILGAFLFHIINRHINRIRHA